MTRLPLSLAALACLLPVASAALDDGVTLDEVTEQDGATEEEGMTQAELEEVAAKIQDEIEVLRGAKFVRPVAVRVASAQELKEYMTRRIEKTTEPGELRAEETVAKLLGLIPPDMDLVESLFTLIDSQAGGFYDPDDEAFYLMAQFANTGVTRTIIAHELTHALDDQVFSIDGIGAKLADNGDAELAFHAVVEGSGTAIMERWSLERMKAGELSMQDMMESGDMGLDELATMPEYLWKPLLASYLVGKTFLSRTKSLMAAGMRPAKLADIDAAFSAPPLSTEQILHPEKYWDAAKRDDPVTVSLDTSRLPQGWERIHANTIGELGLAMVATPVAARAKIDPANPMGIMGLQYTNDAAAGWDGDRYVLLEKDGAHVLYGVIAWDSFDDLEEFKRALLGPEFLAEREARSGFGFELLPGPADNSLAFLAYRGVSSEEASAVAKTVLASIAE